MTDRDWVVDDRGVRRRRGSHWNVSSWIVDDRGVATGDSIAKAISRVQDIHNEIDRLRERCSELAIGARSIRELIWADTERRAELAQGKKP